MSGVIALWSAPRSRSTAFFRSVVERGDLLALHEPFCNVLDYGETDVEGTVVRSVAELKVAIRRTARAATVFFKDTTDRAHADVTGDAGFLRSIRHSFLFRRPDEIAASYYALRPEMECHEVGLEHLWRLYTAVRAAGCRPAAVIDADDLLDRPEATVAAWSAAVGLPFLPQALRWSAGARPEWSRSGRWHTGVAESTGFERRGTAHDRTLANTPALHTFVKHHEPYYRRLRAVRLRISADATTSRSNT